MEGAVGVAAGVEVGRSGMDIEGTGESVGRIVGMETGVEVEHELSRVIRRRQSTKRV
jgi:hypothetical protein